jgi:hypothetical protein
MTNLKKNNYYDVFFQDEITLTKKQRKNALRSLDVIHNTDHGNIYTQGCLYDAGWK